MFFSTCFPFPCHTGIGSKETTIGMSFLVVATLDNTKPRTTTRELAPHVVVFIESTTPWAVGYLWTGDRRYLQAAVGWHDLLERVAMHPNYPQYLEKLKRRIEIRREEATSEMIEAEVSEVGS